MNYKPYPLEFWNQIQHAIDLQKKTGKSLIAAFDADGTLWDADLGENFFQYQIDNKCIPLPPNPFEHYLDLKKVDNDPRSAFLWLAQINQGQSLVQVRDWAHKAFAEIQPNPIFSEQKKLVDLLMQNDVKVYIVTASIKWAIEPGALAMGIPIENIIGIETEIKDKLITDMGLMPLTYKEGKVVALLNRTEGQYPFLASGNTMGDFELLKSASDLKLAVSAASHDDRNYRTEMELITHARQNSWLNHRFI